jgi:hypothetical protein
MVSGGEIFRAAEIFLNPDALCTCGNTLTACEVWGPVRVAYTERAREFGGLEHMQQAFANFEGLSGLKAFRKAPLDMNTPVGNAWVDLNKLAFTALAGDGDQDTWVVDSSKTARGASARPILLSSMDDSNLVLLPLSRSLPGVLKSAKKGSNRGMEAGKKDGGILFIGRSLLGWITANASSRRVSSLLKKEQVLDVLWYEALRRKPNDELGRILDKIGALESEKCPSVSVSKTHMIGGNRTRFENSEIVISDLPQGDLLTKIANKIVRFMNLTGIV